MILLFDNQIITYSITSDLIELEIGSLFIGDYLLSLQDYNYLSYPKLLTNVDYSNRILQYDKNFINITSFNTISQGFYLTGMSEGILNLVQFLFLFLL